MYTLDDYDYILPEQLIAQTPAEPADSCRLLCYEKKTGMISDRIFSQLPDLLDPQTAIFVNTSKVIKARIPLVYDTATGWSACASSNDQPS